MFALFSFIVVNLAVAGLTWWGSRKATISGAGEYFLGRRKLSAPLVALSVLMTNFSTEQLIGLNGDAFRNGATAIAWEAFGALGLVVFAWVFFPRYYAAGVTTIPQYIERRCGRPVRRLMSVLMLISLVAIGVPFVLYSGTLAMIGIFDLPNALGWPAEPVLVVTALFLGIAGLLYAIFGGMRGVVVSDLFYAVVFFFAATLIPVLGLCAMGSGDFFHGVSRLVQERPAALNPFGGVGEKLPLSALLTGMIVINLSAWCANQSSAQKAFAASSLAEGQKGMLLAAVVKLIAPLFFVLPGLIAWVLFKGRPAQPDLSYAWLVQQLLPGWLVGFFAVAVAGATITSVSGLVHSATTLFALDLIEGRQPHLPGALPREGRWLGMIVVAIAVLAVPLIAQQHTGFFGLMKRLNAALTIPVVAVVVPAVLTRLTWRRGLVPLAMGAASATYLLADVWLRAGPARNSGMHWLHSVAVAFALAVTILLVFGRSEAGVVSSDSRELNAERWRFTVPAGLTVLIGIGVLYAVLWLIATG